MKIVGLGHYSRVGKDTFADYLRDHLWRLEPGIRVAKMSFAWKLKQITHDLYAWAGMREPEFYETPEGAPYRDIPLEKLGDKTPVQVWVEFGTNAVRNNVWETTWLDYVLNTDHGVDVLIVPDVRFPNEFDAFLDVGALLLKVVRPGYGPRKTVADRMLLGEDRWHRIIGGTLGNLNLWARDVATAITAGVQLRMQSSRERKVMLGMEKVEPWEPEPINHASPNGAVPGSFLYDAEAYWLSLGYAKIPLQGSHAYHGMLDDFTDKTGRSA